MGHRGSDLITREMARRVIDTITPTVNHNVNIMDAHGVIIAAASSEGRRFPPKVRSGYGCKNRRPGVVSTELYGAEWSVVGAGAYVKRRAGSRLIASQETETIAQLEADAVMLRRACLYPGLFPTLAIEQGRASRGVWQWGIAEAIAHMPPRSLARLARRVAELSPEHCRTVLTLGQHSSAHAAAKELYVHRNTFTQRMDQIQLRTGADPRVGDELAELLLSIYARAAMGDLHIFDAS